jgi:FolB domain-containing protein
VKGELYIRGYKTRIILGNAMCEQEEPREIIMNISFRWSSGPYACQSDDLKDTICYDSLLKTVKNALDGHIFHLVERFAQYVYDIIHASVGKDVAVRVEVVKPHPPIEGVQEVSFVCSDW